MKVVVSKIKPYGKNAKKHTQRFRQSGRQAVRVDFTGNETIKKNGKEIKWEKTK